MVMGNIAIFAVVFVCVCVVLAQQYMIMQNRKADNVVREDLNQCKIENAQLIERCSGLSALEVKYAELNNKYLHLQHENIALLSQLENEKKYVAEKLQLLESAEKKLTDTFKSLSLDALSQNNQSFLHLAQSVFNQLHEKAKSDFSISTKSMQDMVTPLKNALSEVDNKLGDLEKNRVGAYEALKQQVSDLMDAQKTLKVETSNLVAALKNPTMRGLWGEMQLKRVVEISGMTEHCDFQQQVSLSNDGVILRPDMIVYFPAGKCIVIDAKAPLSAYLEAMNTTDDVRKKDLLQKHAQQIRQHISILSDKKYWSQLEVSPEFVVLFLPGEVFLSIAAEYDAGLMEFAMQKRVVLATPMSLIALLRTIALGWRNESLTNNAKNIIEMGQELYKRLADMTSHISDLGKSLNSTVAHFNKTVGSLESRVLVTARKFKDLETQEKSIEQVRDIEHLARPIRCID